MKYLGEEELTDLVGTPYEKYTTLDFVEYYILSYGDIDGSHHKNWLLDQILRIISGTPVIVSLAKWDNGEKEYRLETGKPSEKYLQIVEGIKSKGYRYEEGIAP